MYDIQSWLQRRQITVILAAFLSFWFGFQMLVLSVNGEQTARWLFYTELPPTVDPGLLFSTISHDMFDYTHLISNVVFLLIVGGLLEPYVDRWKVLGLVIIGGYLGMSATMSTAVIHKFWPLAGASTGIMVLWGYTGLKMWNELNFPDVIPGQFVEEKAAAFVALGVPMIPLYEVFVNGNMSHAVGIILGVLYFGVERWNE